MPRIGLQGVSRHYLRGKSALSDVTLAVDHGEILAILGPSGSGKSTLLRLIAGLESPTSGRVWIGDEDVTERKPLDRDVSMVFQNQAPFPHLTVYDNLAFSARARKVSTAEIESRVNYVAAQLGLAGELSRMPGTLSGGERQRVALGRAIVRRPSILLLDEPFSNLDAPLRRDLRSHLLQFHRELGVTTLFVTHDQQEAVAVGNRVAVLHQGEVRQVGTARELFKTPASRFVASFLGDPPMGTIAVALRRDGETWRLHCNGSPPTEIPTSPEWDRLVTTLGEGSYHLGLRAEDLTIEPSESVSERPRMTLPLRSIEAHGLQRLGRVGDRDGLWVLLPSAGDYRVGGDVSFRLDLERATWFDPTTSARVPTG